LPHQVSIGRFLAFAAGLAAFPIARALQQAGPSIASPLAQAVFVIAA
jgi:hypothetical protein